ncbi:MAG: hypothetical protein ABI595_11440, partial [Actinomycetota bacterium]
SADAVQPFTSRPYRAKADPPGHGRSGLPSGHAAVSATLRVVAWPTASIRWLAARTGTWTRDRT